MEIVKIQTEGKHRFNQGIIYFGGEVVFDKDGVAEVDESRVEYLLKADSRLSLFNPTNTSDHKKETLIDVVKDEIDIVKDKVVKVEGEVEKILTEAEQYAKELMAMTVKDLQELAKAAKIEESELKGLVKAQLVEKILAKI